MYEFYFLLNVNINKTANELKIIQNGGIYFYYVLCFTQPLTEMSTRKYFWE
jgi:hypothetical protein